MSTGPNVYITDHNHDYANIARCRPGGGGGRWRSRCASAPGSWLSTGSVVLPGADIGRNVTVAAGSVVRGAVADYSVVAGVPAKVVRKYDPTGGWDPPTLSRSPPPETWPDR